jgi:protein TonB
MTTLLESGARPYGSSKGMALSVLLHGGIITAAIIGTATVALPPREKIEEHPILYVAPPSPKEVQLAPEPLPKLKTPAKSNTVYQHRAEPPRPRPVEPKPTPRATPAALAIEAPTKVPTAVLAVDIKTPTVGDIVVATPSEPVIGSGSKDRSGSDADREGGAGRSGGGGLSSGDAGKTYSENQVERAVEVTRAAQPRYPDALRSVNVEGTVEATFIVGANGRVEPGSIKIISTPHKLFADAVRNALLDTRFRPAEVGGRPVRQLVQQSFSFRLEK